ncbi:hypothetical protein PALB_14770 [Pseudoalteromonas luteoviolacea B = ATCC 29581]|nr:hypothetical protein PALB_14770 [Pseudoalteromonas luteoviolacea B = ATCC 29581]
MFYPFRNNIINAFNATVRFNNLRQILFLGIRKTINSNKNADISLQLSALTLFIKLLLHITLYSKFRNHFF